MLHEVLSGGLIHCKILQKPIQNYRFYTGKINSESLNNEGLHRRCISI